MTVKCKVCGMSFDIVHLLNEGNKCPECGNYHPRETKPHSKLEKNHVQFDEKQKHEKIERMAWDLSKIFLGNPPIINKKQLVNSTDIIRFCWCRAEEFYKFAKKKETENAI